MGTLQKKEPEMPVKQIPFVDYQIGKDLRSTVRPVLPGTENGTAVCVLLVALIHQPRPSGLRSGAAQRKLRRRANFQSRPFS